MLVQNLESFCGISRPERGSSVQAVAWLNAIAEMIQRVKAKINSCEDLDQVSANLEQTQLIPNVFTSGESYSECENAGLERTVSTSCLLVSFDTDSNDANTTAQAQGNGLTLNTTETGLVPRMTQSGNTLNFLQMQRSRLQSQKVLT